MTHALSTRASQHICDVLVSIVESKVGDVAAKHAKSVCSLGKYGKFAYAYHRRDGVRVYLRSSESDGEQLPSFLANAGTLTLKKRNAMGSPWAKLWPYYMEIDSDVTAIEAVPLLAYAARIRKAADGVYLLPSETEATEIPEGGKTTVEVSRYERDPGARARCIKIFGTVCSVCDFEFGRIYGDIGAGFIHVHHLTPLSLIGKRYTVNARTDLRPVCPNCHEMLHRKTPPLTIEELKARISWCHRSSISELPAPRVQNLCPCLQAACDGSPI